MRSPALTLLSVTAVVALFLQPAHHHGRIRRKTFEPVEAMFDFRWMLSPWLIRVVFVLGCLGSIAGGAYVLGVGLRDNDAVEAVSGIGVILLGPVVVRLVCESYIIWFRINATLNDMYA